MKNIFLIATTLATILANGQNDSSRNVEAASTSLFYLVQVMATPKAVKNTESESLVPAIINKKFCLLINQKDTIVLQESEIHEIPTSEIKLFKVRNAALYYISWTENSHVADSLKTEDITTQCAVICDLKMKKPVMSNYYKTTFISEIVFLNNTQASETHERIRKEGFEFKLEDDGSIILKNSTHQDQMVYDENLGKYTYAGN